MTTERGRISVLQGEACRHVVHSQVFSPGHMHILAKVNEHSKLCISRYTYVHMDIWVTILKENHELGRGTQSLKVFLKEKT